MSLLEYFSPTCGLFPPDSWNLGQISFRAGMVAAISPTPTESLGHGAGSHADTDAKSGSVLLKT